MIEKLFFYLSKINYFTIVAISLVFMVTLILGSYIKEEKKKLIINSLSQICAIGPWGIITGINLTNSYSVDKSVLTKILILLAIVLLSLVCIYQFTKIVKNFKYAGNVFIKFISLLSILISIAILILVGLNIINALSSLLV